MRFKKKSHNWYFCLMLFVMASPSSPSQNFESENGGVSLLLSNCFFTTLTQIIDYLNAILTRPSTMWCSWLPWYHTFYFLSSEELALHQAKLFWGSLWTCSTYSSHKWLEESWPIWYANCILSLHPASHVHLCLCHLVLAIAYMRLVLKTTYKLQLVQNTYH